MKNLIILIVLLKTSTILSSLCNIQIFLSDNQDEKVSFRPNDQYTVKIEADKYYQVYCLTDEKVRSRNYISLISSNKSETDFENKLNQKFQITNWSFNEKNITYLKGALIVSSKNYSGDLNYNVFCRFLPIDPSIYCEKTLKLKVITFHDKRLTTFFTILGICVVICILNVLIKVHLNRQKKSDGVASRNSTHNQNYSFRTRRTPRYSKGSNRSLKKNTEFTNLSQVGYQNNQLNRDCVEIPIVQEIPKLETTIIRETERCTTSITGITTTERLIM